jgi:HEAT repeat protein
MEPAMTWLAPLLFAIALAQAPAKDAAQEQIDEFKKFYKPSRSTQEKVEAIHVLEGIDREVAAELLLDACRDPLFPVREAAIKVLATFPSEAVRALLRRVAGEEKGTKDGRRAGAATALGNLADTESVGVLARNLAVDEFEVRRASIVALGRIGDPRAVAPLCQVLADGEPPLKTAALDALALLHPPESALPAIVAMLEEPDWQVRTSAMLALGKLRRKGAIEPLIAAMRREEGRLRDDAARALARTTGFDWHEDPDAWQRWWDGVKERFEVPSDEEMRKRAEVAAKNDQAYRPPDVTDFAGLPTRSRRIVFLIDTSGSMEDLIGDTRNFKLQDRGYRSFMKMDIVKEELARTIDALGPEVRFNILTFATEVRSWKSSLVAANVVNRSGAVKHVRDLKPIGGASQSLNVRAGLSGTAGSASGRTNTYAALMAALDAGGPGNYDKRYGSPVDTIYFLSDGMPSTGDYVEKDDILAEVRRINSLRKVVIHTIAIGDMDHALMRQLAQENGGTFVDLGK